MESIEEITTIEEINEPVEIIEMQVVAVTSNLDTGNYYTADTIEEKLENKLNINSYIDGGEF